MRAIPFDVEQMFTPDERQVIALMVEGERRTEAYARVLGISAQPEQAQRQEVKRIKDRIKRRMQRARSRT